MKYRFFILMALGLMACKDDMTPPASTPPEAQTPVVRELTDTIAELTNPAAVDLRHPQLFIDTTRSSVYYRNLRERIKMQAKEDLVYQMVQIRKYDDEWILYQPCAGELPIYSLSKEKLAINGTTAMKIVLKDFRLEAGNQILYKDVDGRTLVLKDYDDHVIEIRYDGWKRPVYAISIQNIGMFNMMVNHCGEEKLKEFEKFQE